MKNIKIKRTMLSHTKICKTGMYWRHWWIVYPLLICIFGNSLVLSQRGFTFDYDSEYYDDQDQNYLRIFEETTRKQVNDTRNYYSKCAKKIFKKYLIFSNC